MGKSSESKVGDSQVEVIVKYDGLQASAHRIDMRRLGYAMVGLDHAVTYGVIALAERRIANPRERIDFDVVAGEPQKGSLEFFAALMTAYSSSQGSLPFLQQVLSDKSPTLLLDWLSWVFKTLGGRERESNEHFEKLLDHMTKIHGDQMIDRERERQHLQRVLELARPHAAKVAVPVGSESSVLQFRHPATTSVTEIGVPEAVAIRSKEPLEIGDQSSFVLRIDGLIKHTNRGSVEILDEPGRFYSAEIRDPLFEAEPNDYITAMNYDKEIRVLAVPAYRAGELFKLYIMGLDEGQP